MAKIIDLLHEFQDFFLKKFFEMKGILGDLGQMKISLKQHAKPVNKWMYHLNPRYKERAKANLDRMLDVGIIKSVEELKWINPMVLQYKKTSKVWIYFDLRKLNDACLHDPFLTPFTNEVLEGVGDQ